MLSQCDKGGGQGSDIFEGVYQMPHPRANIFCKDHHRRQHIIAEPHRLEAPYL